MKKIVFRLLLSLLIGTSVFVADAQNPQVTVSLNITPPYSTKLSDYASIPGKVVLMLNNTAGPTAGNARVFLRIEMTGDNGIKISSKPNYRPAEPILVQPNVPYVASVQVLASLFDVNSFNLSNITSREIFEKDGLPEGNYQICVRAYSFDNPSVPASPGSPLGCTYIRLTQLEPPLLIKPFDKETINAGYVQNFVFSWNLVPGAEPGTQYVLRVIEMLDPNKNPNDAMNSKTTPAFFETTTSANVVLYGPAQPTMVPGRRYAWSVTALKGPTGTSYRNNGRSEVRSFIYAQNLYTVPNNVHLTVINPNSGKPLITVSNENNFLVSWNWLKDNTPNQVITDTAFRKYGVEKYEVEISGIPVTINKPSDKTFSYKTSFSNVGGALSHKLVKTKAEADAIGLKDSNWYKATITAKDKSGAVVATATSVQFQYKKITEDPIVTTHVKAQLKYAFEGKPNQYNAANTPVEIQVLRRKGAGNVSIPGKPITYINGIAYSLLATATQETNAFGDLVVDVKIAQSKIYGDSIFYWLKMNGAYYIYDHFSLLGTKAVAKDTTVSFGQLVAKTYGYALKLNVNKAYPNYFVKEGSNGKLEVTVDTVGFSDDFTFNNTKGGMTYKSNKSKPQAGITIILYRKDKKSYVPRVEGSLATDNNKTGYVEVGREKTQIEKVNGEDQAIVQFNNLLANLFTGDEYYVLALNPSTSQANVSGTSAGGINLNLNIDALQLNEEGFIAPEMAIKVPKPVNINKPDSLYRNIKYNYSIISKKPPTSLVKGKLLYKWESEGAAAQLRPVNNQKFKVVIDYLVDGNPIGKVKELSGNYKKTSYTEKFFVPDGQDEFSDGQQLLDFGQTMATGQTDAQGNFSIEVVNFNKKGSLGKGRVVENGWSVNNPDPETMPNNFNPADAASWFSDPVTNPWDGYSYNQGTYNSMPAGYNGYLQTGNYNNSSQGFQNSGSSGGFNFNPSSGFFDAVTTGFGASFGTGNLGGMMQGQHGPSANFSGVYNSDEPLQTLERIYRIVPDNEYLYPTNETFSVQAFEAKTLPASIAPVKETSIKVTTKDNLKNNLKGMLVTVFRPIGEKTATMPFGEGDGKYLQTELTSPLYKNYVSDAKFEGSASELNYGSLFTNKFEVLAPVKATMSNGVVTIPHLLQGYPYYIMACSDPTQGVQLYKATFTQNNNEPTLYLEPLASRALIKVKDNSTQLALKYAMVYANNDYKALTDASGYAELKGSKLPVYNNGTTVYFKAATNGYKESAPVSGTFNAMGSQFVRDIFLDPSSYVKGRLVSKDENNKAIKAFVKSNSGKTVETDNNGYFTIPVPATNFVKLDFIPKDVAYFDSTKSIAASSGSVDLKEVGLYRRKHRIMMAVVDASTHGGINNATVQLGDKTVTTTGWGLAPFEFENVSVNNYTFIVRGADGSNYIPVTKNVKNEESKGFTMVTVELEKGSEITGTVTLDNKAVKNAKVYIDASNQQSGTSADANLLVARTNSQGKYTMYGVPANNQQIHLIATLDTSFTVNGDNGIADIKDKKATTNLSLTSYTAMSITNVYGFPLSVEKITPTNNADEVKVTGTIKWANTLSDFAWIQGNDILRVEDVVFKAKTVNGKKIGEAIDANVNIEDAVSIKLRYLDKYNVKLTKNQGIMYPGSTVKKLSISKQDDYGVIQGKINIVDNSFNYPSTYINFTEKDQFYLGTVNGNFVNTTISAVTSLVKVSAANNLSDNYSDFVNKVLNIKGTGNSGSSSSLLYNICNNKGDDIAFKFIEFDATANAKKSYIAKDGKIHLNVKMQCHVQNAKPEDFSVDVNDVVLDDNKVYASSSSSPLEVKLEKWTLQIKDWKLDPKEGGIISSNGLIKTSRIDIPFSTFNLRSDMFIMDNYQVGDLKIGGGIKSLSGINASNAAVVFDNKTGTDMKPHWRFSMSSTGNPVAKITDLPDLGGEIGIDYIQLLSNDENIFQLKQTGIPLKLYGNSVAKFTPQSISNGPDYFAIAGALNIGAPRTGDMLFEVSYSNVGGSLKMKTGNVKTDFEGKGFVHFTSIDGANNISNIVIDATTVKITGEVVEKPTKSFNAIPATLKAVAGLIPSYNVELEKGHVMQLTSEGNGSTSNGYKLTIDNGGMKVVGNDWGLLTYSGNMESNASTDKGIKPMYVNFKVLGDVSVDGTGAKMDNIETGFGTMNMVFDFAAKRLMGTLTLKDVKMGTNSITGTVETLFDPNGFYVAGGGTAQISMVNPFVDGTYNLGFMIGSYPLAAPTDHLWQTVTAYKQAEVKNNCFVGKLAGNLKGFYLTVDRIVLDESVDFDFIIVSGYVEAKAIIGADLFANFSGQTAMGVAANVYARGAAGMSAITGTSMNGSTVGRAGIIMNYSGGKFNLDGKIDISFTANITQSLLVTTVSASKSVGASASVGTSGFKLELNSNADTPDCY